MTQPAPTTFPIIPPRESLTPQAYRLVITTTHCTGCGSLNEASELYQITTLRSRITQRPNVTNSIPTDRFMWNVPLQIRHTMRLRSAPVCHRCYTDASLSHLPTTPSPEPECTGALGAGANAGDVGSVAAGATRSATVRRHLTTDDI